MKPLPKPLPVDLTTETSVPDDPDEESADEDKEVCVKSSRTIDSIWAEQKTLVWFFPAVANFSSWIFTTWRLIPLFSLMISGRGSCKAIIWEGSFEKTHRAS